jgi:hypothetical protein
MARLTGGQRALKAFVTAKNNPSQFEVKEIIKPHQLLEKGEILAKIPDCWVDPDTGKKKCKTVHGIVTKK